MHHISESSVSSDSIEESSDSDTDDSNNNESDTILAVCSQAKHCGKSCSDDDESDSESFPNNTITDMFCDIAAECSKGTKPMTWEELKMMEHVYTFLDPNGGTKESPKRRAISDDDASVCNNKMSSADCDDVLVDTDEENAMSLPPRKRRRLRHQKSLNDEREALDSGKQWLSLHVQIGFHCV